DLAWQIDSQRGCNFSRARCADHRRWDGRIYSCRASAAGIATAVFDRFRLADRIRPDGAGCELHRSLWRAARARTFQAPARGRVRLLFAASVCQVHCERHLVGWVERSETHRSASVPIPKFARASGTLGCELRNQRDTTNIMILVPLLNPKFANGLAA